MSRKHDNGQNKKKSAFMELNSLVKNTENKQNTYIFRELS